MVATALEGLVRGLAVEIVPVRFNLVSAGFVGTDMMRRILPEEYIENHRGGDINEDDGESGGCC